MKYLRIFPSESDYQSYTRGEGNDYITPHVALVRETNAVKYQKRIDPRDNYCTITALEDDLTVSFSNTSQYSLNGTDWNELPANTATPAINTGEKICFKAELRPGRSGIGTFTVNKKFNLKGNVMSLIFGDEGKNSYDLTGYDRVFINLFSNCTTLQSISNNFLPATTLAKYCYQTMFAGCTSLVNAPELPATTLMSYCYAYMFGGTNVLPDCSNIDFTSEEVVQSGGLQGLFAGTKVTDEDLFNILPINPETGKYYLPATTLAKYCYQTMFSNCTSLVTAPELPATTLANGCYSNMFSGTNVLPDCSNIDFTSEEVVQSGGLQGLFAGTKVTDEDLFNILPINPETGKYYLPATTLTYNCYESMFQGCTSLVNAPELPATTLAYYCYRSMFNGCTSLVNAPELPATTLTYNCYESMFQGCTSLVNAPELPATTLEYGCYQSMFYGCTSLTTAPELPATILANSCYSRMFYECTSLVNAPELPATTLANGCYNNMFNGCTSLNYIKMLATNISAGSCLSNWVSNVSATGTFVKSKDATWSVTGVSGIPSNWTVETA